MSHILVPLLMIFGSPLAAVGLAALSHRLCRQCGEELGNHYAFRLGNRCPEWAKGVREAKAPAPASVVHAAPADEVPEAESTGRHAAVDPETAFRVPVLVGAGSGGRHARSED
jgi:hypothetical protein